MTTPTPIKRIAVIGAGAMGGFYAGKFFDMDNTCISVVAEGERYDRLNREGLTVRNKHYALPVITPKDSSPPSDLILVAVKYHHLPKAIEDMKNRVGKNSIILSIMNGIDSEKMIGAAYGMDKVLYCIAVGIDAVKQGNSISLSTEGKILFGEAENHVFTEQVERVRDLFDRAGIAYEVPEDMLRALWWKFMINVGINQPSAVMRAPYGVFQNSREARELMESAMREIMPIAEAEAGVNFSEKDLEDWYSILLGLSPQGKTSMLQDMEADKKTEVEMFAGKVIKLGHTHKIPTPVNQTLFRLIKVMEKGGVGIRT